jgi:hypothetical protein
MGGRGARCERAQCVVRGEASAHPCCVQRRAKWRSRPRARSSLAPCAPRRHARRAAGRARARGTRPTPRADGPSPHPTPAVALSNSPRLRPATNIFPCCLAALALTRPSEHCGRGDNRARLTYGGQSRAAELAHGVPKGRGAGGASRGRGARPGPPGGSKLSAGGRCGRDARRAQTQMGERRLPPSLARGGARHAVGFSLTRPPPHSGGHALK